MQRVGMGKRGVCLLVCAVGALLVAGCSAKPDWSKPGVPTKKVTEDWNYCRADANETAGVRSYDGDGGGGPADDHHRGKKAQRGPMTVRWKAA